MPVDHQVGRGVEGHRADLALREGEDPRAAVDEHDADREQRVDAAGDESEDEDLSHQGLTHVFVFRQFTLPEGLL